MSLDKTNESQSVEHKNVKPQARSNLGDKARTDETTLFRNLETVNSNITVPYPVETGLLCCDHACWLWWINNPTLNVIQHVWKNNSHITNEIYTEYVKSLLEGDSHDKTLHKIMMNAVYGLTVYEESKSTLNAYRYQFARRRNEQQHPAKDFRPWTVSMW